MGTSSQRTADSDEARSAEIVAAHAALARQRSATYWSVTAIFVAALLIALFPVRYLLLAPGPLFNTVGAVDGVEMITISDTTTYPVTGELNMTTVTERGGPFGGLTLAEAYFGWLNPNTTVAPVDLFYSPEVTKQEAQEEGELDFTSAQSSAIAASLGYLKIPVTSSVVVSRVLPDGPAAGKLMPHDVVKSVNGVAITAAQQLPKLIRPMKPGTVAKFGITRAGAAKLVPVVVATSPQNPNWSYVGVSTTVDFHGPFPITFGVDGIGGPSAGLMFTLGIIDKLTPTNLADGRVVAGTGTIDPLGGVGSIGGIAQKLHAARDADAELFLAPAANCEQVRQAAVEGLNIAKVASLQEAMDVLAKWRAGDTDLPRC